MTAYMRAGITVLPAIGTSTDPATWPAVIYRKHIAELQGMPFHRLTPVPDDPYRVVFEAWSEDPEHGDEAA